MTNWSDAYIHANGINIHYYRTGGDKPQIVFNHGAMDDGLCWTRVVKELEDDFDVIMFDARGHGLSDSGNGDYSSESRAKDLAEAILALGLEKPVVGGHSLGADVSMQLAALYPDIPRAIFLEDPPITMPGEPIFGGEIGQQGADALKMMVRFMTVIKILPLSLAKAVAKKGMPDFPDDEIIPWVKSKKRMNKDFIQSMSSSDTLFSSFDVAKKINIPTLLIYGDRDSGAIVSNEVAQKLANSIPTLQTVHLEGANHDIRRARFDGYMTALKTFLYETYAMTE